MGYDAIKYEKSNGIAKVSFNQPKTMNCLVQQCIDELGAITKEIAADPEIKAVILTGEGKAFCAGGDLNRFMDGFDKISGVYYVDAIHEWVRNWVNLKVPTIAAVNGAAVGAGLSIALLCDIIIASENALFGSAFINMGLIPDLGAAYFMQRAVGVHKAMELMLTGRNVKADEAVSIGLANYKVSAEELMSEAEKLAARFINAPSYAVANTKRLIHYAMDMDFDRFLETESFLQGSCFVTEDSKEAVTAFLEKRKPVFKGE